jgi:hypothetical protein
MGEQNSNETGGSASGNDPALQRATENADKKPVAHGTPHEVDGAPVRSPADLEGDGSPGTSDPATKQLPP